MNYKEKFNLLDPKTKEAKDQLSDNIKSLELLNWNEEMAKEDYDAFVAEFPDSVTKTKVVVEKPEAKKKEAKPGRKEAPKKEPKPEKKEAPKTEPKPEKKEAPKKEDKPKTEKEERKEKVEKKEKERKLTQVYLDFNKSDEVNKMRFILGKDRFRLQRISEKKKVDAPKQYSPRMQSNNDTTIARGITQASNATLKVLESKKASPKKIEIHNRIKNAQIVLNSEIDETLIISDSSANDVELIAKGFYGLVLASMPEKELLKKYANRPKTVEALEALKIVTVEREKNVLTGTKITSIELTAEAKEKVLKIRNEFNTINKALQFKKGGKI